MRFENLMLDLETKGTMPGCALVSISAVPFDFATGIISEDRFDQFISLKSCIDVKLYVDNFTEKNFWKKLPKEVKDFYLFQKYRPLFDVLVDFNAYLDRFFGNKHDYKVWSYGSSFDPPILSFAYKRVANSKEIKLFKEPWQYKNLRCTRTLRSLAPEVYNNARPKLLHHIGMNDCLMQIAGSIAVYRHFEGKLPL